MKQPNDLFLRKLCEAVIESKHRNVAEHLMNGLLWASYPEWYEWYIKLPKERLDRGCSKRSKAELRDMLEKLK